MDIAHPHLADATNHTRSLDAGSGQKALLVFSETTSKVFAFLVDKDGVSKAVANENMPKSFENIKTLDNFNCFLDNSYARGVVMSDGEAKVYVEQKGLGGMWNKGGSGGGMGRFGGGSQPSGGYGPHQPSNPGLPSFASGPTSSHGSFVGGGNTPGGGPHMLTGIAGVSGPNGSAALSVTTNIPLNGQQQNTFVGAHFKANT